jgi:hypothetical protein
MTRERPWSVISTVALVVVAAVWLWFLFAYADLIFKRPNANSYDRVNAAFDTASRLGPSYKTL